MPKNAPSTDESPALRVFVSSTSKDLELHRALAKDLILGHEWQPVMMENFRTRTKPTLQACRELVESCDLFVLLVAFRRGWVPSKKEGGDGKKSVTAFELDAARSKGIPVRVLRARESWPGNLWEETQAGRTWIKSFRDGLNQIAADFDVGPVVAGTVEPPPSEDFRAKLRHALLDHRQELLDGAGPQAADPRAYLQGLKVRTGSIDIRGLAVGKGQVHKFPIEELYISLTTTHLPQAGATARQRGDALPPGPELLRESREVPLHDALQQDRLLVVGDPGAGKTTFLHRVVHALCQTELGEVPQAARERVGIVDRTVPLFIKVSELAQHLLRPAHETPAPAGDDAPAWLPHYLAAAAAASCWALDVNFFRAQLETGHATVLFDGLDEAPDRVVRHRVARLIENAAQTYRKCRFVVSSRPGGDGGDVPVPEFARAQIDPLSDAAVEAFLTRWCGALYADSAVLAQEHLHALLAALRAKPAIRRIARNPVMLTALAVLQWNDRVLPEQRADLYESILGWLARAREDKPGRENADTTLQILRELALAMQNHPDGMRLEIPKRDAAEILAREWGDPVDHRAVARAEAFLDAEELDSGIIVGRGSNVKFWHRTFQEYLAARAVAARLEGQQKELLWGPPPRVYLPEWLEVMLLLAGVLHKQGREKVDNLFNEVLVRLAPDASLADAARTAGLLGGMLRDLAPLKYRPRGTRYDDLLQRVHAIYDPARSASVPLQDRIAAADLLGQAGDSRLEMRHADYWVPIENFRIARYPVTVGQYQQFIEDDGYHQQKWWTSGGFGDFTEPDEWDQQLPYPARPVVGVSWFEAMAYCAWARVRLPTEAEWERAARGTEGREYPWGTEPAEISRLNFAPDFKPSVGHPTPVGIYPLGNTPHGICDMAGNVWEWCADCYDQEKPAEARVLRGGSWNINAEFCRPAFRDWIAPELRYDNIGFRVALPLAPRTVTT